MALPIDTVRNILMFQRSPLRECGIACVLSKEERIKFERNRLQARHQGGA